MPSVEYEKKYTDKSKQAVYLSLGGELVAMFIVTYKGSSYIAEELRSLEQNGVTILVRTIDSNITQDRIAEDFGVFYRSVKILPTGLGNITKEMTDTPDEETRAYIATKGGIQSYLFASTFVNVGTMRNTGFELDLNVQAVKTKDFSYNIGFVGATNNNKFLHFSNNEFTGQAFQDVCNMESPGNPGTLQRMQEGERLGNYFTWSYAGIDENGNWLVWNKDNTEKISINEATTEDKRVTGNGLPKFTASLSNTFSYKNWDLTVFLSGAFGFDIYNVHDLYYGLQSAPGNVLKKAYDKNAGITTGLNVLTDYFLEKGDYLKLDVVTLGYRFNINNKWLDSIRLYVTGKNLATITGFSGVDPASYQMNGLTPGTNNGTRNYYPTTTQLLFGLQLDF